MNGNELAKAIGDVWAGEEDYGRPDVSIVIREDGSGKLTLTKMYEHVPVDFARLQRLSELLGTTHIDAAGMSASTGCDTCDYGSSYETCFEFRGSQDLEVGLFCAS